MDIIKKIDRISNVIIKLLKIRNLLKDDDKEIDIQKETDKILNDEIENKNNTRLSDTIRKEKQMKIDSLKKICILIFSIVITGCSLFNDPIKTEIINNYDINSLKETDKTYRISGIENVKVYDADVSTNYFFDNNWFVVHKDFLKTYNENQNTIIQYLENTNKKDKLINTFLPYCIGALLAVILLIIIKKVYKHG